MVNEPKKRHGLRGIALQHRREELGLGQVHVAREAGLRQPQLSDLEGEAYDRMPPGQSLRIQAAMDRVLAGESPHWPAQDGRRSCGCEPQVVAP